MRIGTRARARPPLVTPRFLLVQLSTLAYFLAVGVLFPTLPLFVEGPLGGTSVGVGVAVGAFTVTAMLLRPVAGRIGDRRGRRLLIVGGALAVTVSVLGYPISRSLAALVAFRLLTGVGEALFFTGVATAVNDLAPEERRGEALSYFSLALYAGLAVGPFLGESVLERFGFVTVFAAAAASAAVAAVLGLSVRDQASRAGAGGGALVHRAALLPGAVLAASVWGFSAFSAFMPLYARELGLAGSRFLFLLYAGLILAVRLFGARLPDRFGVRRMVSASLLLSIAGLLLMASARDPAALFAGTPLFAVGQSLAFPALMALAVRRAPPEERGSVVGTFTAFFDFGYGAGAASLGLVAAATGFRGTFVASAAAALLALVFFARASPREA